MKPTTMPVQQAAQRLICLCDSIPGRIQAIKDADFTHRPAPGKWSRQEILGHLLDSATNNHQRFVRGRVENVTY
ncbi:hypothetical protein FHW36_1011246 [Chitinophaga polysaccharea]|uniref:DinB family protein n=1 Tax=Chitinophaga polysaccharea TaxID=1293035 RepID=A0A561Q4P8_9BACT|nr:hypothetical protein [Chitinophaga polysaccharea]TWF45316.1 hypothetical protein FHW36_1011246 [Chitinophaga polysaccharea]